MSGVSRYGLFDIGSELCLPDYVAIKAEHVTHLETVLDKFNAELTPLKEFILPGGHKAASFCHLARAICRRAERRIVSLQHDISLNLESLKYINRLSDLLFVFARYINKENQHPETLWQHEKKK